MGDERHIWFAEPTLTDPTPAYREESTADWLKRSTNDRAVASRDFLNRQISALPEKNRQDVFESLHDPRRYASSFFEVIVARTLQTLGAEIEIEPGGASDIRLDVQARFMSGTVQVEAVSPVFDGSVGEIVKARNPLLDIIESLSPPGIWLLVTDLPDVTLQDSRKPLRRAVEKLFRENLGKVGAEPITVSTRLVQGNLSMTLIEKSPDVPQDSRSVGAEPPLTTIDNSEERIRRAVSRKRRQGRRSEHPAILAIHASGLSSSYEAFDRALYGVWTRQVDRGGREVRRYFDSNGEFTRGSGDPTWSAVLAFVQVGFTGGKEPVLYLHPRYRGPLPERLCSLEVRQFDRRGNLPTSNPPSGSPVLPRLEFVSEEL